MKAIIILGFCLGQFIGASHACAQESKATQTSKTMYVERNEFHLKFGTSKAALELWKEYLEHVHRQDSQVHVRVLTDISGPAYTLIVEQMHETFAEAEPSKCRLVQRSDWKEFYQKFIPLCENSDRTFYKLQIDF